MDTSQLINKRHKQIISYIRQYSPSLKCFPERYLPGCPSTLDETSDYLVYVCPLCAVNTILIARSVGYVWSAEFSFDHYPPESVGGFLKMLVCQPCNSEAGKSYDFALKEKINRVSFDRKVVSSTIPAKSVISNVPGSYRSSFYIDEQKQYGISLKPNERSHAPHLEKWIEKSKTESDWEIKITIPNPDELKVAKALAKTAYLYCFASWGYDFVYSAQGERIRKFLKGEEEYPVKIPSFWLGESIKQGGVPNFPLGLCYLQKPEECKTFSVNIALKNKETKFGEIVSVLIPNPTPDGLDDLKRIEKYFSEKDNIDVTMAHVTDFSVENNVFDGYKKSWEKLISS